MADYIIGQHLPEIISLEEAIAKGLKRYFTGEPCKHGHISERLKSTRVCLACRLKFDSDENKRRKDAARKREKWIADPDFHRAKEATRDRSSRRQSEEYRTYIAEYGKGYGKKWREANPDKTREHNRNRRARKALASGRHTAVDIKRIAAAQKNKCAICRDPLKPGCHVDHIQPLSKGGSNWPANLQVLCGSCNSRKKDRDPIEHMQSLGMLL